MVSAAEPEITPDQTATSARSVTPSAWTYIGRNGKPRPKPISVKNWVADAIHAVRLPAPPGPAAHARTVRPPARVGAAGRVGDGHSPTESTLAPGVRRRI